MDTPQLRRALRLTSALATSVLLAVFAAACGSSSINVNAPTTSKCQVTASSSLATVPASGGSGTISVTTTRDCTWTASSGASWVTFVSAATGQGSGTIDVRVGANADRSTRRASVSVNDAQLTIEQAPAPCTYSVAPANSAVGATGGTITVQVTAGSGCTWTATSNADWLSVSGGGTASGSATITVAANTGGARTGTATIAGQTVTINQADATVNCTITLSPTAQSVDATGGNVSVSVAATAGCRWTATSSADWVTIASGAAGTGPGQVTATVAPNPAATTRQATITIGSSVLTILQGAAGAPPPPPPPPCSYAVAPLTYSAAASGGTTNVTVTAGDSCAWVATSSAPWISIASGARGTGSGSVALRVAANGGGQRTGIVTIANQTFTVTQAAAACAFSVSPPSASIPANGGTGTVNVSVTAGTNCAWTASSSANWITFTGDTTQTGNGSIGYSVSSNSGAARTGTITIAGQTISISQLAAPPPPPPQCTFTIAPANQSVPANGGNASVTVTASDPSCSWTSTPNAPWITVTSGGSGTGNGTVALAAAANTGPARSGTVTIAGQTFTVAQDAAPAPPPCTYSISPSSASVPVGGGTASVAVTAGSACAWTAASNAPWITISSGSSGTGNGSVALTIAANTGAARSGTVTIAGQTFTVSQDAAPVPCSYSLAPTSQSFPFGGGAGSFNVTAGAGCAWTAAASDATWITLTAGSQGTSNGTVTFTIAANTGAARTGTITVAGQTFSIAQDAAPPQCTYAIAPQSQSVPAGGGTGSINVTTGATCAWTASTTASWISFTGPTSGTGNGSVGFSIASNTGAARTGTITINGQTFTVSQDAAPCTFSLSAPGQPFDATGGSGSVTVTTGPACTWTAVSNNADWITVTSAASVTGPGTVTFTVAANTGGARAGSITIAGQSFLIGQAPAPGRGDHHGHN